MMIKSLFEMANAGVGVGMVASPPILGQSIQPLQDQKKMAPQAELKRIQDLQIEMNKPPSTYIMQHQRSTLPKQSMFSTVPRSRVHRSAFT